MLRADALRDCVGDKLPAVFARVPLGPNAEMIRSASKLAGMSRVAFMEAPDFFETEGFHAPTSCWAQWALPPLNLKSRATRRIAPRASVDRLRFHVATAALPTDERPVWKRPNVGTTA